MNSDYKFAIVNDNSFVAIKVFKTETAAFGALKFWNRNGNSYSVFPIDGVQ